MAGRRGTWLWQDGGAQGYGRTKGHRAIAELPPSDLADLVDSALEESGFSGFTSVGFSGFIGFRKLFDSRSAVTTFKRAKSRLLTGTRFRLLNCSRSRL